MRGDEGLKQTLLARGVVLHAPEATVLAELDPERIEAGVEIFPGSTVVGRETLLRRGTCLGRAGGGWFEDLRTGRDVDLFGGFFQDCVLLDGVQMRGHAEVRGGSLLEEGCKAAHHVGFKMTVLLPFVTAGSLVNFADALVAGGSGPGDFSEIGSVVSLYNYSPRDDKWASRFGDVPRGVFLRQARIFVGGQCQIVSPVHVDYGAVLAAGGAVRGDVPAGRLYAEPTATLDRPFEPAAYGPLAGKLRHTVEHVGQLRALAAWYRELRLPAAGGSTLETALLEAALAQVESGARERVHRLERLIERLPRSLRAHEAALAGETEPRRRAWRQARLAEQAAILAAWPRARAALERRRSSRGPALAEIAARLRAGGCGDGYLGALRALDAGSVEAGRQALQDLVDALVAEAGIGELPTA